MITIDGSVGEGGGQIFRSALSLSLCSGTPVRISGIRARRARPGLMRQHLTALRAAAEVGRAEVSGAEIGSREVVFRPRGADPGEYAFNVGSAGSTTLVLQTVLPALLGASTPSRILLEGGTHNPLAPPFEFLDRAFLPLLGRMGVKVTAVLEARGFYPAGGGRLRVEVEPGPLGGLELLERGEVLRREIVALVANLPGAIARREIDAAAGVLGWPRSACRIETVKGSPGPGNVVNVVVESEHVTEVFTGFGEKGVRAEHVAERVAAEARAYLEAGVPVGEHLADQLVLPMALGGGGAFRTVAPSSHTRTQIDLMERMLDARIAVSPASDGAASRPGCAGPGASSPPGCAGPGASSPPGCAGPGAFEIRVRR
jgi:RNA 3'-terminal phosphate cyclase (ATP)